MKFQFFHQHRHPRGLSAAAKQSAAEYFTRKKSNNRAREKFNLAEKRRKNTHNLGCFHVSASTASLSTRAREKNQGWPSSLLHTRQQNIIAIGPALSRECQIYSNFITTFYRRHRDHCTFSSKAATFSARRFLSRYAKVCAVCCVTARVEVECEFFEFLLLFLSLPLRLRARRDFHYTHFTFTFFFSFQVSS